MRICIVKATNRIIEMQSSATAGTLIKNAENAGYLAADIEEREVDDAGYLTALAADPVEVAKVEALTAIKAAQELKAQEFLDNLPSWEKVKTAIEGATTIAALRAIVLKLARVVYWLARDRAD